jgi:hypothetical protein
MIFVNRDTGFLYLIIHSEMNSITGGTKFFPYTKSIPE